MSNPVVVEVLRGDRVESAHRGAGAVVDADGGSRFAFGDVDRPIYPRSAVKAFQALPLIESGAADRLGLSDAEIALACASHSGEDAHVALARDMLAKAGRDAGALECGAHWPLGEERRPGAWRERANARRRCTTTARASTPASSASPASRGSIRRVCRARPSRPARRDRGAR